MISVLDSLAVNASYLFICLSNRIRIITVFTNIYPNNTIMIIFSIGNTGKNFNIKLALFKKHKAEISNRK